MKDLEMGDIVRVKNDADIVYFMSQEHRDSFANRVGEVIDVYHDDGLVEIEFVDGEGVRTYLHYFPQYQVICLEV